MNRRSILKLFGISAAAATTGAVIKAEIAPSLLVAPNLALQPPKDMTYQWKRIFITPDEPDLAHILQMVAYGWKPVPMSRHREHFSASEASYWIEHNGLVLMEKPTKDIPSPRAHPVLGMWEEI